MPADATPDPDVSFEKALRRLENIVEALEDDASDLDAALASYEEGVVLARACLERLETAEQRVEELALDESGKA